MKYALKSTFFIQVYICHHNQNAKNIGKCTTLETRKGNPVLHNIGTHLKGTHLKGIETSSMFEMLPLGKLYHIF
jgi:hypothetical protein